MLFYLKWFELNDIIHIVSIKNNLKISENECTLNGFIYEFKL